jgi:hypothetical protein
MPGAELRPSAAETEPVHRVSGADDELRCMAMRTCTSGIGGHRCAAPMRHLEGVPELSRNLYVHVS